MERQRQFLNTFIRQKQLTNTQQDLKMYCSNYYVRETLQNLSEAIADHCYRIILLPQIMTY